jgi:hypothetical protein
MAHLSLEDFTSKKVQSSKMLKKGGVVGPGSYTRTRKNMPVSPNLLARMDFTARAMPQACSQADACVPSKFVQAGVADKLIGKPVPGAPGKTYVACDDTERARRLAAARACAINTLSTKGGVYGVSGGVAPVTPSAALRRLGYVSY